MMPPAAGKSFRSPFNFDAADYGHTLTGATMGDDAGPSKRRCRHAATAASRGRFVARGGSRSSDTMVRDTLLTTHERHLDRRFGKR
jgi:hypothetical protein